MKRTHAAISVMAALMDDPTGKHWGYELGKHAGIRSGVLYPVLHRMLDEGWLEDGWEDPAELGGRPPRRYYELTGTGITHFSGELAVAQTDRRFQAILGPALR